MTETSPTAVGRRSHGGVEGSREYKIRVRSGQEGVFCQSVYKKFTFVLRDEL